MHKLEGLIEDIKQLPVNKLKEEMRELQVSVLSLSACCATTSTHPLFPMQERQARIENLLLVLTRGMRNEAGNHSSVRHESL